MNIHALLVEDNASLAETIVSFLALEDIECDYAATGPQGLDLALSQNYEAILLDINLPRMNGLEVCAALRKQGIDIPILMLTARDTIDDKLAGFNAGTDDYLVKPFELTELVARVKALAKRRSTQAQRLEVGDLVLDLSLKVAYRQDQTLTLTPTCWKLLLLLMRSSPHVVSRADMEQAIWSDDDLPGTNALKVHIHKLRQQVDKPFASSLIHTVPHHGIVLRAPDV